MRRIIKFLRIPARDKLLLVRTLVLLGVVRAALPLVSYRLLNGILQRLSGSANRKIEPCLVEIERITWAVASARRYVPGAACLAQALTAQFLLARRGCQSRLQIGVAKSATGRLEAHAWVEYEGRVLIGDLRDLRRFKPLFAGEPGKP